MEKTFITENSKQTQKLGEMLAGELQGGEIVCLSGDLGAGKTTFTQGLLKGLGAKAPFTSPTFLVMKQYKLQAKNHKLKIVYHIDAYRVKSKDIINLGWEEMIANKNNVIIVEWAERIRKIIPAGALWIKMKWVDENKRKLIFKKTNENKNSNSGACDNISCRMFR